MASRRELVQALLSRVLGRWALVLLLVALLLNLAAEGPPPADIDTQIAHSLTGERFDFVVWEIQALLGKLTHTLVAPQRYMDESARHDFFLGYLALVERIHRLDGEIQRIYTDPDVADPETATAELRAQLVALRQEEENQQLLAEAILEEQTACILANEGFGALGQEFPPVGTHFTALPSMLIVSPRDRIERITSLSLRNGLDTAQRETIEEQVDSTHDVSSLVTGIGGLSAYPAMLLESSSLNWIAEVAAHEWTHHYLLPLPLGWNYDAAPETRTINETVASIVGKEIGRRMVAQYYPELLPPEPEPAAETADKKVGEESDPPAFDFRAEMHKTRIRVDELLAQGKIEEAEAFMEQRRRIFVAQGYRIRKLNQAYFAFHGAYADEPGAAGKDPIGPAVRELRDQSSDLHTFVNWVAHATTLAELEELLR